MTILDSVLRIRRLLTVVIHTLLIVAANLAAFWLRFDGEIPDNYSQLALRALPWLVIVRLAVFVPFRLFEGLWRYTSLYDLRNILLGVAISTAVFYPISVASSTTISYPRSVYVVDSILLICLMTGIRLTRRVYVETFRPRGGRRVLIYGAGDAGELIVRDMRQNTKFDADPIGFLDDDESKVGQHIHGVPVLGSKEHLSDILKAYSPDDLLIAIPSASRDTLRAIVRTVEPFRIRITTLPRLHDLIGSRVDVGQIRQLKVEDLLARDPVGLDYEPVRRFLQGKRILITGAGGSIGSELCRQIANASPSSMFLIDRYENGLFQICNELSKRPDCGTVQPVVADITDEKRIGQVLSEAMPHVIFHAAAHKHVPLMEDNPCEAVKNNVRGTRIMAEGAIRCGAERFVLISTDKAVNPTSVMGATKHVAELIVRGLGGSASTRLAAVRFGNVLASNGSVVPTFLDQIAKGGPVTVTHPEMRRFFMLIPEAVQLVLHAGALDDAGGLFALEMGDQVKVVDMARDLIRLSGYVPDKDIAIEFTGIRPGEKLYEELVGEGEFSEPSSAPKIMRIGTVAARNHNGLGETIARLESLAIDGANDEVVRTLRALMPTTSVTKPQPQTV